MIGPCDRWDGQWKMARSADSVGAKWDEWSGRSSKVRRGAGCREAACAIMFKEVSLGLAWD